jgi:hypothetical protein
VLDGLVEAAVFRRDVRSRNKGAGPQQFERQCAGPIRASSF